MRSDLPTDADVVVVGTGAFGLAVAVHLARFGAGRVLALDRFDVGSQTSPRAAGLFKSVQADYLRTRLAALAIEIVRGFEKDMGVPVPYVQSGSLMIARTERHARVIETEIAAARRWGVTCDSITTAELVRLAPYVEPSTVQYAAYVPEDIYIEEPSALLEAYRLAAERLGARVLGHVPATNIVLGDGGVEAVETPYGRVRTETVIDAAGAWVRAVGRMAGIDLAVMPMRHQLAITEALPGTAATHPITRIVDAAVYVRPCRG
ncbi:MAG: FAD-binding oxidoreductase, partial [Thermomicrobium sp.]|nr:FAD-binding oxidoreductase [Thermomicrobium sp.]